MNIFPKSYTIKTKLLLNFGLLLGLSILSLTVYQSALNKVEAGYEKVLAEEHNIYDQTLAVKELMLRCRKNESGFRLNKDIDQAAQVLHDLETVRQKNSLVMAFASQMQMSNIVDQAKIVDIQAKAYANSFQQLVESYQRKGLTQDDGLQGEFRKIAHTLFNVHMSEHALGPMLNSIQRIRYYILKKIPSSNATISTELNHLQEISKNYKARSIYMNQLFDILREYNQAVQDYLDTTSILTSRDKIFKVETISSQLLEILYPIYVPNAQVLLLQIRRHEKDYLLRGHKSDIDQTHDAVSRLISALQKNIADKDDIRAGSQYLQRYLLKFDQLVQENVQIETIATQLTVKANAVEQAGDAIILLSKEHGDRNAAQIWQKSHASARNAIAICVAALLIGLTLSLLITKSITQPLQLILDGLGKMTAGEYGIRLKTRKNDTSDTGTLAQMFNRMAHTIAKNAWFSEGQTQLSERLREDKDEQLLCRDIIQFIASYLKLPLGAIYLCQEDDSLMLMAGYAYHGELSPPQIIPMGEGLLGEAARGKELIILDNIPADYSPITSSLGDATPQSIAAIPILWQKQTIAVIELASLHDFPKQHIEFFKHISEAIAVALMVSKQRTETLELLQRTQEQAEELQAQQEELKTANEELDGQTQTLLQSEEELKTQQEELQVTNEELEEKSEALLRRNEKIAAAKQEIEDKANTISAASRYKSEFLANMSHELRTPLNSLLLLAHNLAKNTKANLDSSQIESAKIIYNSGNDLLRLINDILDLSKIEAGRTEIATDHIAIQDFANWLHFNFQHMTADKELAFSVIVEPSLPKYLVSDLSKLEQIMRNLTANAIKFTEKGSVTIQFDRPSKEFSLTTQGLNRHSALAISVIDTGIGIAADQHNFIFDAFKQADGGTSRKFGGTGLGLSISKSLAELLGGEIHLTSESGHGSTFTLYLPFPKTQESIDAAPVPPSAITSNPLAEQNSLKSAAKTILIIEESPVMTHEISKLISTHISTETVSCGEQAISYLKNHPVACLLMDINLPDMTGFALLSTLNDIDAGNIPPIIIYTGRELTREENDSLREYTETVIVKGEKSEERLLDETALFLHRVIKDLPTGKKEMIANLYDQDSMFSDKRILLVDDDMRNAFALSKILEERGMKISIANDGKHALELLTGNRYDLILMDIMMPIMDGYETMAKIRAQEKWHDLPIIALTAKAMPEDREKCMAAGASDYLAKPVDEGRLVSMMRVWLYK